MPASIDDIFNGLKDIAKALNLNVQTSLQIAGLANAANISTATLVKAGPGRLAVVSVLVAGAVGKIYDAASASATTNPVFVIPAAVGVTVVNIPLAYGLVVAPGAGQTVTVSYS